MPPIAATVLPHAKSLNNITLLHLLRDFASSSSARTMDKFLTTAIAGLLPKTAAAITSSLGIGSVSPDKLGASQVAALCQVLRDDPTIRPPSPQCLSPAGEYNLRLGVLKELKPRLVATFTDKPGVHEGHAFLVEAAVSLGGSNIREGINIFRFANRYVFTLLCPRGQCLLLNVFCLGTEFHFSSRQERMWSLRSCIH